MTPSMGQIDKECGAKPPTKEELAKRYYIGDNKHLLKVLRKHDFYLPEDYFDQLDDKGLYKGKRLKLKDVKKPKDKNKKDSTSNNPNGRSTSSLLTSTTTYYLPLKIWIYKNSSGQVAISQAGLDALLQETMDIFRVNDSH